MKPRFVIALGLLLIALGVGGWLFYQDTLVPIALAEGRDLYVKANPEFGEDAVQLEALMPAGQRLEAFLAAQSDLTLIARAPEGGWVGQLVSGLQSSRHGRRWRISIRPDWPVQDGSTLDASTLGRALSSQVVSLGGEVRVIDSATLDLRFKTRQHRLLDQLARWRVPGTGPFIRRGASLARFERFPYGRAGVAGLRVATDPTLMESHAWAGALAAGRWAWAVFPGNILPDDMAKVRLAPYDEIHLKDGTVWFLSRRMRRLRPNADDWTRTRLFGAWKGAVDLPYDPLGM